MICLYHNKKTFCFASLAELPGSDTVDAAILSGNSDDDDCTVTPAKLLEKIGNNKTLWLLSLDPEALFEQFSSRLTAVAAAGGVVVNSNGALLMIERRGSWDLPKGHVETGETPYQAAVREIKEETGVDVHGMNEAGVGMRETGTVFALQPQPICRTMHFYDDFGRWELKTTWWYGFTAAVGATPVPQTEEDITRAEWLSGEELTQALEEAYPLVREVVSNYEL